MIGAGFAVVAVAPAFGFALAGMATAGLAEGSVSVSEQGILQRRTPDAVRSRATAATEAAILGAFALSFPAAGFLINLIGVRGVYLLAGAGCAVSALILIPAMRELDRSPGPQRPQVPDRVEEGRFGEDRPDQRGRAAETIDLDRELSSNGGVKPR